MVMMIEANDIYLEKARESLDGAESEFINRRYNNAANRCYYAAFQAAISALSRASIRPPGADDAWSHKFVHAQFVGQLIKRRKVYPVSLRNTLAENYKLRETADYQRDRVTEARANRAVSRTEAFLEAIREGGQSG